MLPWVPLAICSVGAFINSAFKWCKLSLALKSRQLGAVRGCGHSCLQEGQPVHSAECVPFPELQGLAHLVCLVLGFNSECQNIDISLPLQPEVTNVLGEESNCTYLRDWSNKVCTNRWKSYSKNKKKHMQNVHI